MYVVSGATGNTGSVVADYLLKKGVPVRVILRDMKKGNVWKERGADVFFGDLTDPGSLEKAFKNADAAYLINPPSHFLGNPFKAAEDIGKAYEIALNKSNLRRIVVLSSIGAHLREKTGIIHTTSILEDHINRTKIPAVIVRAAYFMENWASALQDFVKTGVLNSFLAPLNRAIPMVSTQDIGNFSAKLMIEDWETRQIVDLEGPKAYSPQDVANAAAKICHLSPNVKAIPEREWHAIFGSMKMSAFSIEAYCEMLHSFNDGTLTFEKGPAIRAKGEVGLENAIQEMLQPSHLTIN